MADDVVVVETTVIDVQGGAGKLGATRAVGKLGPQLAERAREGKVQVLARVHRDGHAVLGGIDGRLAWKG